MTYSAGASSRNNERGNVPRIKIKIKKKIKIFSGDGTPRYSTLKGVEIPETKPEDEDDDWL